MNIKAKRMFFGLLLLLFFASPVLTHSASIYLAPSSGSYAVGEQFSINVFVSSGGQEMNAVKVTVVPLGSNLQLISVSQAGSIIDFWAQEPQINGNGSLHLEGVMLGNGFSGSAGKLATLVVRARSKGNATLVVSSGSVLANDGLGTELPTTLDTAQFTITGLPAVPVAETIPGGFTFAKDLRQGDSGDEVTYLQICLRDQGFYAQDVTGYFGSQTKQAVIDFQEEYSNDILVPWGFTSGTGLVSQTTREKLNTICFVAIEEEIPEQLFDISLELDDNSIDAASDLLARVIFVNFGTIETPIDISFRILDEASKEVYTSKDAITVETEEVFTKEFKYLYLPIGKYRIELDTLYDTDVEDKFYVEFEVIEKEGVGLTFITEYRFWVGATVFLMIVVIFLLLAIIALLLRRLPEYRERQNKQMLKREKTVLRKAHKHLLTSKTKTEGELQKIENKLKQFSKKKRKRNSS